MNSLPPFTNCLCRILTYYHRGGCQKQPRPSNCARKHTASFRLRESSQKIRFRGSCVFWLKWEATDSPSYAKKQTYHFSTRVCGPVFLHFTESFGDNNSSTTNEHDNVFGLVASKLVSILRQGKCVWTPTMPSLVRCSSKAKI